MEESQTSESVAVLPDMSEPLTSETEEASALTTEHEAHPVAVTASVTPVAGVPGVGVPVSLPVGSIIGVANSTNGTTFNVITSDQLQVRRNDNVLLINFYPTPITPFVLFCARNAKFSND